MTLTAERNTLMDMTTTRPPVAPPMWAPVPPPAPARGRSVTAIVLAMVATLLAAAALVVALTRPVPEPAPAAEEYTPAEIASAKNAVCSRFKLASDAVRMETNGGGPALARIALSNGAGMLESEIARNPALGAAGRDNALALARVYRTAASGSALGDDAAIERVLAEANDAVAAMRESCA